MSHDLCCVQFVYFSFSALLLQLERKDREMKILVSGNSFFRQFSRFALKIFIYIYFTIFKMLTWSNLIYECVSFISTECQWSVQNLVLHYGNTPWLITFYILVTYPLRRAFLTQGETRSSPDSCSLTINRDNSIFSHFRTKMQRS